MNKIAISRKVVKYSIMCALGWVCLQIVLFFGVEKKTFIQLFADILGGGAAGAVAGLAFFVIFGAIGYVSGAIYGALGLLSLMVGGALGGLGLGSLLHIARNPDHYNFDWPIILIGALVSWCLVLFLTAKVMSLYDKHGPSVAKVLIAKLEGKNPA